MQKVLTFCTQSDDMRAGADGWGWEDGDEAVGKPNDHNKVGLIGSGNMRGFGCPRTPLHALGVGWKLLAPPVKLTNDPYFQYKWWFVKE